MNIRLWLRDWLTRGVTRSLPAQLPEGPQRQRHNRSLWYDAQLQARAVAAGCLAGGSPPPPAPQPLPPVPPAPNWLGWTQTALLVAVLGLVASTHFQGCSLPWPGPAPAPTPGDPFTQALQTAYTDDAAPDKAASLGLLQQIWAQATTVVNDAGLKTVGDLYTRLHAAANALLGDKLTGVRQVIEAELNKTLSTQPAAPLDPVRGQCRQQCQRVATALKGVKG